MGDWCRLQAVELVEGVVDGCIGDEVVDGFGVVVVWIGEPGGLVDEGRGTGEGVVDGADEFGV